MPGRRRGRGRNPHSILFAAIYLSFFTTWATNLALAQTSTPHARTEPGPYSTQATEWDGLSTLAALAAGSGLQVVQRTKIRWEDVSDKDIVLLLYPTALLSSAKVSAFIRNGGRMLIADDLGAASKLLSHLGGRRTQQVHSDHYQDDHSFAPTAKAVGIHPLSKGISTLATNHPTALTELRGMESIFEFDDGSSLVTTGDIGLGRFILLSDPSVLINRMLEFEGNLQFAINLLHYLSVAGKSARLVVLTGDVHFFGSPKALEHDGTLRNTAGAAAATIDNWLDDLNEWLLSRSSLRNLTLGAALGLGLLLAWLIPASRQRQLDGSWTRASSPEFQGASSLEVAAPSALSTSSYLLPATVIRDNVNTALELATGEHNVLTRLSRKRLLVLVHPLADGEVATALDPLLPLLEKLPERAQAAADWRPRFVGHKEFEEIHRRAETFFQLLTLAAHSTRSGQAQAYKES